MTRDEWAVLSPEEQRSKVAELCGWQHFRNSALGTEQVLAGNPNVDEGKWELPVPDYLNDLNAMHEVELAMTEPQKWDHDRQLAHIAGNTHNVISATAAQRAEAFALVMENEHD